jgi:hypothetical protein
VALAAVKGDRTASELVSSYGVHATQINAWKNQLVNGATEVFADGRKREHVDHESREAELFQQIGKLQMELDWLKGCQRFFDGPLEGFVIPRLAKQLHPPHAPVKNVEDHPSRSMTSDPQRDASRATTAPAVNN